MDQNEIKLLHNFSLQGFAICCVISQKNTDLMLITEFGIQHSHCYIKNIKMRVHKTITFHFACEISSCTFRDELRQKVFKNMAIRKIIGPKRDKVIGKWRKLHKDKLHYLYSSTNISRVMKV